MRILNVCAEFVPLAKSGGLGDVTAGLARYLSGAGHEVITLLPRYGIIAAPAAGAEPVCGPHPLSYRGAELAYSIFRQDALPELGRVFVVDCPELLGDEIYATGDREARRIGFCCCVVPRWTCAARSTGRRRSCIATTGTRP